jgi:hypothetical protein
LTQQQPISSFVLRVFPVGADPKTGGNLWRIKVTHVQTNEAVTVRTMEEAASYMDEVVERGYAI